MLERHKNGLGRGVRMRVPDALLDRDHHFSEAVQLLIGGQTAKEPLAASRQAARKNPFGALQQPFDMDLTERGEAAKQQSRRLRNARVSAKGGTQFEENPKRVFEMGVMTTIRPVRAARPSWPGRNRKPRRRLGKARDDLRARRKHFCNTI